MVKAKPFDPVEYLHSPEMIAAYLTEALESNDSALVAMAIGAVARACGMEAVAEKAGLSREDLYRALADDAKPEFATVLRIFTIAKPDDLAALASTIDTEQFRAALGRGACGYDGGQIVDK